MSNLIRHKGLILSETLRCPVHAVRMSEPRITKYGEGDEAYHIARFSCPYDCEFERKVYEKDIVDV